MGFFCFLFFFCRIFGFLYFCGYLGLKTPHIFGGKKEHKKNTFVKGLARQLLGFSIYYWLWVNVGPTQSVLRIFARNFVQTCLETPGRGWSRKKLGHFFLPTVNAYQYLTSLKVCDWSGHIFCASASPRSLTKKGLCYPLPLFMAVSIMIPNMWYSSC